MPFPKPAQLKRAFRLIPASKVTLRRRLMLYLFSALCVFAVLILLLLSLFNILNPISGTFERVLSQQLEVSALQIQHDLDELSSWADRFSSQLSAQIQRYLKASRLSFDDLKNNGEALIDLQSSTYSTLYSYLQTAPCSGAFYMLDTSVNTGLENPYYSGLYLKYANLYAENTVNSHVCLFRGSSSVARENDINLHSTWQYETKAGDFPHLDGLLRGTQNQRLSAICKLPDAWEHARFLCAPILDDQGRTIGVCGYEISDLFFQLSYRTIDSQFQHFVCALLDQPSEGYTGQFAGSRSGYMPATAGPLHLEKSRGLTLFFSNNTAFIGASSPLKLDDGIHSVAVMLPHSLYKSALRRGQLCLASILFILAMAALFICLWISKRYVAPILEGLDRIKGDLSSPEPSNIPEINDLLNFLAQKDKNYEEELQRAEERFALARSELEQLASRKYGEIDPDGYTIFLSNLHTLTPKEKEIFSLYLDGKTAKEIQQILGINENTLKYHNKNIYSKLGVSSRKQLLQYAALMKQRGESSNSLAASSERSS